MLKRAGQCCDLYFPLQHFRDRANPCYLDQPVALLIGHNRFKIDFPVNNRYCMVTFYFVVQV